MRYGETQWDRQSGRNRKIADYSGATTDNPESNPPRDELRLAIPQGNNIRRILHMQNCEELSIWRPMEVIDVTGGEVCDLMTGRAIQWLHPNVVHILIANRVSNSFLSRDEVHGTVRLWGADQ